MFVYSEPNQANGVKLSEEDLVHLMRLLWSYSYKWNPIGLSLGFTQHELNTIFGMFKLLVGAPVSYLQELLSQWVQWPTADHPSHPTLGALCTALRSSLVGLGSLAEEVEGEMKQCATGKKCTKFNSNFLSHSFQFLFTYYRIYSNRSRTSISSRTWSSTKEIVATRLREYN